MIAEHERIALLTDVAEEGLQKGDIGTVVSVLKGGEAYTVEFMTLGGKTVAVITLLVAQIRPITADDMQQARPLVTAA